MQPRPDGGWSEPWCRPATPLLRRSPDRSRTVLRVRSAERVLHRELACADRIQKPTQSNEPTTTVTPPMAVTAGAADTPTCREVGTAADTTAPSTAAYKPPITPNIAATDRQPHHAATT